ncbi:MAG: S-adenosylmethionine decarboxylase related protein [Clostridiaceae bacterium]|nr:S-adenosylmethionine decarboxylase related protein [Clostridiaceae bacterium]
MSMHHNISILGSSGGLAKAILSILNKSIQDKNDPIYEIINNCQLHLIDRNQKKIDYFKLRYPHLEKNIFLYEFDLNDNKRFEKHLKKTNTKLVVDISWADTVEMLACCNKLGISYINTALENIAVDEDEDIERFTLLERYLRTEEHKNKFSNMKAIIGSGMNPGVVQWMALELMKHTPNKMPRACYIVEHDSSFYVDKSQVKEDTVYITWAPECFLDEAILNFPLFVQKHTPLLMYNEVYESEFKVTLGGKQFYGCLMPHEEVITLGKLFDMELGFIYRVNEHTTELIRRNLENLDVLWNHPMKLLDPTDSALEGEDLVGILLVYDDKERYMYNVLTNEEVFKEYHTSATYFQVACGLYAGISTMLLDDIAPGVYYLDELLYKTKVNYGKYLRYYMKDFVIGENKNTEGLLLDRRRSI